MAEIGPSFVEKVHVTDHFAVSLCEVLARNYDPCMSCAAHILRLHIERL